MSNPLDPTMANPEPPEVGNALATPAMAPRRMPAAPTHSQCCGALTHFSEIRKELLKLEKNPALGRSDIQSSIIDSITDLVAKRIMKPEAAVIVLADVPSNPLLQRKWIQAKIIENRQAANSVLDHHSMATPGSLDFATESRHPQYDRDDHHSLMDGLAGNYTPAA
jgi:hypothetical protein